MKIKIGIEHLPLLEKLQAVLKTEPDPVKQQIGIELLMAQHAGRAQNGANTVLDAMRKHAGQMVQSFAGHEAAAREGYKYFSQTTSGWEISTSEKAAPDKRWRAEHPEFGIKYFREHDDILNFTVTNMMKTFEQAMGFKVPKDRK